ncbi:hypothetical protein BT63DRAFT_375958 [Microthyrium microscopicum]|uniref:RINT-1 family protein n=1 Tax=Microthyrium microscopicum TaxID=703497 RepID=A0A6A6U6J6_9PEZI|nr:hypothetical protein BT63DRAFT_375958 [Microthyrium microscopicum]
MAQVTDARVGDYLDDKLQSLADLESLDSLLLSVRNQQSLLKSQLESAQKELKEAKQESVRHGTTLNASVKAFNKEQADIDRQLMLITQSDTSDEAAQKFEASMDKLNKLSVAKEYVRLLQDVDTLSDDCISHLGSSDADALESYSRIRKLLSELEDLQVTAEGAAPHLVDHTKSKTLYLREQLEKAYSRQFEDILKEISWPNPDGAVSESQHERFARAVSKLLELQLPELEKQEKLNDGSRAVEPLVLFPFKVMIKPLELGFRYHFEGDRPTNRLERPEFFLSHVTERILAKYIDFVEHYVQPVLLEKFRGTDLALNYAYIDSCSAFITSLLPMVRNKIYSVLPQVLKQPPLLSHLIHEVTKFDTELRNEWQYDGGSRGLVWHGLAYEVLSKDDVFVQWLKVEKDFALSRYQEIVDASDSFDLDFDSLGAGKTKPSKAAIRVNDLLEATTDNYKELVSFSQKLRFLIDIQIAIFDLFHERLTEALGAYISRTSTIGRTSREEQAKLQGIEGLERLGRVFGSADYLERAMRDWNDDVFFLEMWSELQHRASLGASNAIVAGNLTIAQVAARTSSTINNDEGDQAQYEEGALFDETAAAYMRLRTRTESIMTDLLTNNVRQALGPYSRINPWASLSPASTQANDGPLPPNAELDGLMQSLRSLLSYLVRAVGTAPLRRLAKQTLQAMETVIFDQVILGHSFSGAGTAQLAADNSALLGLVSKYLDAGTIDIGLGRLSQAIRLLSIPIKASKAPEESEDDAENPADVGLFEVGKRLFEGSGEDAKKLLDDLGLDRLSVGEARKILAKRVELGS